MKQTGILLINLGTPDSCKTSDVRKYLAEFLNDYRVIDLPTIARKILLYGFILPLRPQKSAKAYKSIWTNNGSPLLTNSLDFADSLSEKLGNAYQVTLGMRYGNPSIASALDKLLQQQLTEIWIVPMFPQYSSAASGSAMECALKYLSTQNNIPSIKMLHEFHIAEEFIAAYALFIKNHLENFKQDYLLFSYHGVPERHIKKSKSTSNAYCYQQQCYNTSHAIANMLQLNPDNYGISFQSRLGRTPWIKPYTDQFIYKLHQQGVRKLAMLCPSFTADCLETLEEVGIGIKKQWLNLPDTEFKLLPCLNNDPLWISGFAKLLMRKFNNDDTKKSLQPKPITEIKQCSISCVCYS